MAHHRAARLLELTYRASLRVLPGIDRVGVETDAHPWRPEGRVSTIGSMPEARTYAYADLATFPEDNLRREIIDGELIVTAAPYLRHQQVLLELAVLFSTHLKSYGGGRVFIAPADVVFSDVNVVEPDLLFVPDDRQGILTEKNIQGVPALVVEVVSDTRMDRVRKRDLYARFGVPDYWIVDPEADRVEVYRLTGDAYAKPEILEPGETLTYDGLPGFAIDLRQLFAR